jgi:hypothetical protein
MAITFICECCKKRINAPDEAGGKWGKCPSCGFKCYIPMPPSDDEEEIKLAPIDEEEETQYKEMMRETYHVTEELLHQIEDPGEPGQIPTIDEKVLTVRIVKYLGLMANGSLDEAANAASKITPYKTQAKRILEKMLNDEMPEPELAKVPAKVLTGFIRNMLSGLA